MSLYVHTHATKTVHRRTTPGLLRLRVFAVVSHVSQQVAKLGVAAAAPVPELASSPPTGGCHRNSILVLFFELVAFVHLVVVYT